MYGNPIAAGAAPSEPRDALRRFALAMRWRHVRGRVLGTVLRAVLALSVPALALAWLVPGLRGELASIAVAILLPLLLLLALGVGVAAFWRGRGILTALDRELAGEGEGLGTVRDELATWLEFDRAGRCGEALKVDEGMLRWLERDVTERLRPHQQRALAAVARPSLGRFRWLVPLALLLLLLWLLSWFLAPPWSGAVGGRPDEPVAGRGAGGPDPAEGGAGGAESGESGGSGGDEPPPREPAKVQPPPLATEPESPPPEPVEPEQPAPLLELPEQQRFVVPDFVGDGPTRRARVRAAEIEREGGGSLPNTAASPSSSDAERPEPPPPTRVEFERAAEAALRARHVPPAERAMVRRFFERLQRAGR